MIEAAITPRTKAIILNVARQTPAAPSWPRKISRPSFASPTRGIYVHARRVLRLPELHRQDRQRRLLHRLQGAHHRARLAVQDLRYDRLARRLRPRPRSRSSPPSPSSSRRAPRTPPAWSSVPPSPPSADRRTASGRCAPITSGSAIRSSPASRPSRGSPAPCPRAPSTSIPTSSSFFGKGRSGLTLLTSGRQAALRRARRRRPGRGLRYLRAHPPLLRGLL